MATQPPCETFFVLALQQLPGVGPVTLRKLIQAAGSAEAAWSAPMSQLKNWLTPSQLEGFAHRPSDTQITRMINTCTEQGVNILSYEDPRFPRLLQEIHNPPVLLFAQGHLNALNQRTLAVVGTRKVSDYGRKITQKLVAELAPAHVCVVSGLAAGVDAEAHQAALVHQLPTVAVFGCGLDIIFPRKNRPLAQDILDQGGLLLSEYSLGTEPSRATFPQRNRIVAGLAYGTVVVEGNRKSGAMITARLALEENRSVYAVPGSVFSPGSQGPLSLIQQGAMAVTQGQDILEDLHWEGSETKVLPLVRESVDPIEQKVLEVIGFEPTSIDVIPMQTQLSSAQVNETLTLLELKGYLHMLPGAKVCRA